MRALLFLTLVATACSSPAPKPVTTNACYSSREYITTMEFIRGQKDFALNEKQTRELANKVSTGCTGASKRFIQVTKVLVKSGLPSQTAIETGVKYALTGDEAFNAFMTIFKSSYLESLLDLDLKLSLDISTELSQSYKGKNRIIEKEFSQLVEFCVDRKSLDLPLVDCAKTATRVLKSGEDYEFKIGKDFIDVFNFVTEKGKANIPTYEAMAVAENVVKFGPEAKTNFINAYEYGIDKKGLDYTVTDAIEFGKTMASRSIKKEI